MKYIDADQIRAEIERRKKGNMYDELPMTIGRYYEDRDLLAFLDSIQERPVIKKSNALFDKCVENCDPVVMKEVFDNIDKMLGRQPVEGLEDAAENYIAPIENDEGLDYINFNGRDIKDAFIAGAEWGMNQCPLPEDTTIFMKGVAEGKRLMMEEAVEADVNTYKDPILSCGWAEFVVDMSSTETDKLGDKVRIIVIKEEQK